MAISGATQQADYGGYEHDPADSGCADADHLGIVFVHGVGFQNRGETLLSWSDRLIAMLSALYGGQPGIPSDLVHRSEIYLDSAQASSIEVRLPATDLTAAQHWLMTEAFWAASIQPPSVPTMLRWLGARGAAAMAAVGPARAFRNSVYLTSVVIGVLVLYAAIRAITMLLPITSIRNAIVVPLDRYLTGWSGDMHVLLFDPPQSANIRTQVRHTVDELVKANFDRVVLIAHSGGAVASYMTLTDRSLWDGPNASRIVSLITLGEGLNIAWRLSGVGDGGDCADATGSGRRLTEPLRTLHPRLRWHDYYSVGDMVPETELRPPACLANEVPPAADSHRTQNVPANPHGSYWDNDEEFLYPVVQRLLKVAPKPRPSDPPPVYPETADAALRDRRRRIGMATFTSRIRFASMVAAIVGGTFLGGARLDDLGQFVASILTDVPLVGLLAGPLEWIRAETGSGWWDVPRIAGTIVFSILLLLLAAYPLIRLFSEQPESGYRGSDAIGVMLAVADWLAALLPPAAVVAWGVLALVAGDGGVAPGWAVWPAIVIALLRLGFAFARTATRENKERSEIFEWIEGKAKSGLGVMLIVPVVGFLAFSGLFAIAANAPFGGTRLGEVAVGAIVVWVLYRLLSGVTNWRWNAWDEQEREQFRQDLNPSIVHTAQRRWGRRIDLLVIGFGCTAAVLLSAAVGAPLMDLPAAWLAGAIVIALIVVIWVVGAGQDAANSRGGVEAPEMTPLPTAS